jgi:hypothetical protein
MLLVWSSAWLPFWLASLLLLPAAAARLCSQRKQLGRHKGWKGPQKGSCGRWRRP